MGEDAPERRGAWHVPAPAARDLVRWPAAFGTRFMVCVDTEEEFDWAKPLSRTSRNTSHVKAIPAAHARFASAGVPLVYLVDHPIVGSAEAVAVLCAALTDGHSAIGAQLHPWVNPPFAEEVSGFNSFTGNLPLDLQKAKLEMLTEAIALAFGTRPLIHRAGRYGIGPDTAAQLAALGYRIDSSMRAGYDYSAEGGPDFRMIGNPAFRMGEIVEIPFGTVFTGAARRGGAGLHYRLGRLPRGIGVAARLRLLSRVALTPEDMPIAEAKEAVRVAAGEGLRLLNFAFHSPSLEPGHTPYTRDAADLAAFWHWWDEILALLDRLGIAPASLADIIAACEPAA